MKVSNADGTVGIDNVFKYVIDKYGRDYVIEYPENIKCRGEAINHLLNCCNTLYEDHTLLEGLLDDTISKEFLMPDAKETFFDYFKSCVTSKGIDPFFKPADNNYLVLNGLDLKQGFKLGKNIVGSLERTSTRSLPNNIFETNSTFAKRFRPLFMEYDTELSSSFGGFKKKLSETIELVVKNCNRGLDIPIYSPNHQGEANKVIMSSGHVFVNADLSKDALNYNNRIFNDAEDQPLSSFVNASPCYDDKNFYTFTSRYKLDGEGLELFIDSNDVEMFDALPLMDNDPIFKEYPIIDVYISTELLISKKLIMVGDFVRAAGAEVEFKVIKANIIEFYKKLADKLNIDYDGVPEFYSFRLEIDCTCSFVIRHKNDRSKDIYIADFFKPNTTRTIKGSTERVNQSILGLTIDDENIEQPFFGYEFPRYLLMSSFHTFAEGPELSMIRNKKEELYRIMNLDFDTDEEDNRIINLGKEGWIEYSPIIEKLKEGIDFMCTENNTDRLFNFSYRLEDEYEGRTTECPSFTENIINERFLRTNRDERELDLMNNMETLEHVQRDQALDGDYELDDLQSMIFIKPTIIVNWLVCIMATDIETLKVFDLERIANDNFDDVAFQTSGGVEELLYLNGLGLESLMKATNGTLNGLFTSDYVRDFFLDYLRRYGDHTDTISMQKPKSNIITYIPD